MGIMAQLTERELQVVQLLVVGRRTKEIAAELCVESRTVKAHLRNARDKTGSKTTYELAAKVAKEMGKD